MKRIVVRLLVAVVLVVVGFVAFVALRFRSLSNKTYVAPDFAIAADVASADVALGHHIYAVRSGCIDCHGQDLTGAMVMENGAMGSIYGPNITPSTLKDWSDEDIARAIRYGIHRSGRSLRFMPSFDFAGLSKGDVAALVAYVRSVPAIQTAPHPNVFGPVAKGLSSFGKMPVMFPAAVIDLSQGFAAKPPEGPNADFGRYLANSCTGCHNESFTGGPIPGGDPSWPPAANIRLGADPIWTKESFTQLINSGVSPKSGQMLRPPMPIHLLRQLRDDEITALWEYLKTLK